MGLFTKKSEMEKNIEEVAVTEGRIADQQARKIELSKIRENIELELTLGSDTVLEKRLKKLAAAEVKAQGELESLQERLSELHKAIAEEQAKQRKAEIAEASKEDEERHFKALRAVMIRQEMEKLLPIFENFTGLTEAESLKRMAGLGYGESLDSSGEADLIEAHHKAYQAAQERAEKEAQEVAVQLKKVIGLK